MQFSGILVPDVNMMVYISYPPIKITYEIIYDITYEITYMESWSYVMMGVCVSKRMANRTNQRFH